MPKFSIIVPAYNAEDRIRKVLGSVTCQSFKDYELIVVCDSCKDNTEKIAREEFNAITSIEEFGNDGLSRSKGLDLATGEWVLFLDDDDWWLDDNVLEIINDVTTRVPSIVDIIQFGFIWKGKGYYSCHIKNTELYNSNAEGIQIYANVWSKCIKRSFIGDTRFPNIHSISDSKFVEALIKKSPKISFYDYPIYYYNWLRKGSISQQDRDKKKDATNSEQLDWSL